MEMNATPSGDVKRTINFDMSKEVHRHLFEFSKTLNLSEFVRQKLAEEMAKRKERSGTATLVGEWSGVVARH